MPPQLLWYLTCEQHIILNGIRCLSSALNSALRQANLKAAGLRKLFARKEATPSHGEIQATRGAGTAC